MSTKKKIPPILFIAMIAVVAVWRLYAIAGGMLPPTPGVDVAPLDSTGKVPSSYLPAGSSASIPQKLLNYTTLAVDTSASDIGAATNAAIARLGGRMGTVTINPKDGPYTFSTRINIPKGVTIDAGMSTLVWNSNSGVAVYSGDTSNSLHKGGLKNCVLTTVAGYATGHTNIGIYSGGDPAGVISSTTAGGALQAFDNVDISGFKYGYSFGNNTWVTLFSNAAIHDNYDGLYDGGGQTNSGEEMMITDSLIFNNMHDGLDLNNINNEWVMKGGSLDYNGNVGVGGSGANITCVGVHMEQSHAPLISFTTAAFVSLSKGEYAATAGSGTDTSWFQIAGGTSSNLDVEDARFVAEHPVTYVYGSVGSYNVNYTFKNLIYVVGTPIQDIASCDATAWYSHQGATTFYGNGIPPVMGLGYGWVGAHLYNPSLSAVPGGRYSLSVGENSNINDSIYSAKLSFINHSGTTTSPHKASLSINGVDSFLWDQLGNIWFPHLTTNGYLKVNGSGAVSVDTNTSGVVAIAPSQVSCTGITEFGQTTFDTSQGNNFALTITNQTAIDLKPQNGTPGQQIELTVTGGSGTCTLYLASPFAWTGSLFTPVGVSGTCGYLAESHLSVGAGAVYHLSFVYDGTNWQNVPLFPTGNGSGLTGMTAAQVGLGNVTNDAQLKRAANDFSSFTQKTTPASGDVLLIEDSAASGAKKYCTVGSLPSSGGGTWGSITGTLSSQTDLQTALNAKQGTLGYTAEDQANKSNDGTMSANSTTLYPTQHAVVQYISGAVGVAGFQVVTSIPPSPTTGTVYIDTHAYPYYVGGPSTVSIADGGTGHTTAQTAIDALAGAVTSGQYLRGNGTHVVMSGIQAADVPTLNQNTTGTAAGLSASSALPSGTTATTQSAGDNSTKVATTAYCNSYLPLAGGTMTGPLNLGGQTITRYNDVVYSLTLNTTNAGGGNYTPSLTNGPTQKFTMSGQNVTITMPSATSGASLLLIIVQDSTARTITWSGVTWTSATAAAGSAPALATGSGHITMIPFYSDGANWYGFAPSYTGT